MSDKSGIQGYGEGTVGSVMSVDEVGRQAAALAEPVSAEKLRQLAGGDGYVAVSDLYAGYGKMEILHGINLRVGRRQSLCLIGPNGAGKSTVLHAIFGFNRIFSGRITIADGADPVDITRLSPSQRLAQAGIAYILQDKSIFPGMTVEENLWMGGFLKPRPAEARQAAEKVFDKYPSLAARRKHPAGVLSGGERRLLEISRALVMDPRSCWWMSPRLGWSRALSTWYLTFSASCNSATARPLLWSSKTPKKAWSSPISAMCWYPAKSRWPTGAMHC